MTKSLFKHFTWSTVFAGVVGFIAGLLAAIIAHGSPSIFKWQTLIAGLLGFAAAIIAVILALGSEQRKADRALQNIKRALGIEIRQYAANAHRLHERCLMFLGRGEGRTNALEINDVAALPVPGVYSIALDHIVELGDSGPLIVLFYIRIATIRDAGERFLKHPQADHLPNIEVAGVAEALMMIAETGRDLMSTIKTGVASEDAVDVRAIPAITKASEAWAIRRKQYFPD